MKNTLEVKYFDGQSSAAIPTTVSFDESMKEFYLLTADGISFVWSMEDLQREQYGDVLEIRNNNYSGAILKIDNKEFSDQFYLAMKQNKRIEIHTRLLGLGFSKITAIAVALFGLIVFAYFYVLPPIAEKSAVLLPESFDDTIGDLFMESFLNESEIDSTKSKYLEQFAAEVNLNNNKSVKFTVVNSELVNAFASPNGQIVVFSAILENMESPEELVALLGHEVAHINNRHSVKMLCRNLAGYILISLVFSDVNGIMTVMIDNAHQLHTLSYSRAFEQEADEQGMQLLMDNNIDPNGMVKLFEQLESDISIPEIISSHPLTHERIEHMQEIISESDYDVDSNDRLCSIFEQLRN